ncbi:hypothetical protein GEMRC1_002848 [Eukaryota sp. GEM-RC1]
MSDGHPSHTPKLIDVEVIHESDSDKSALSEDAIVLSSSHKDSSDSDSSSDTNFSFPQSKQTDVSGVFSTHTPSNVPSYQSRIAQLENSVVLAKDHITKLRERLTKEKSQNSTLRQLLNNQDAIVRDAAEQKKENRSYITFSRTKSQKEVLTFGKRRALREIEDLKKAVAEDNEVSINITSSKKPETQSQRLENFIEFCSNFFPFVNSAINSAESKHGTTCSFHFRFSRFIFFVLFISMWLMLPILIKQSTEHGFRPFEGIYPKFWQYSLLSEDSSLIVANLTLITYLCTLFFAGFLFLLYGKQYYKQRAAALGASKDSHVLSPLVFGWNWNEWEASEIQRGILEENLLTVLTEQDARKKMLQEVFSGFWLKFRRGTAKVLVISYVFIAASVILFVILEEEAIRRFTESLFNGFFTFLSGFVSSLILATVNLLSPRLISFSIWLEKTADPAIRNSTRVKRLFIFRLINLLNISYGYLLLLNGEVDHPRFTCSIDLVGYQLTNLILITFVVEKFMPLILGVFMKFLKNSNDDNSKEFLVADAGLRVIYITGLSFLAFPYSPFTVYVAFVGCYLTVRWDLFF